MRSLVQGKAAWRGMQHGIGGACPGALAHPLLPHRSHPPSSHRAPPSAACCLPTGDQRPSCLHAGWRSGAAAAAPPRPRRRARSPRGREACAMRSTCRTGGWARVERGRACRCGGALPWIAGSTPAASWPPAFARVPRLILAPPTPAHSPIFLAQAAAAAGSKRRSARHAAHLARCSASPPLLALPPPPSGGLRPPAAEAVGQAAGPRSFVHRQSAAGSSRRSLSAPHFKRSPEIFNFTPSTHVISTTR